MSLMDWSNDLDVHVDEMNNQHKGLLEVMNALFDSHQAGAEFNELKSLLDKLADLTIKHFEEEEVYMESIEYPGIKGHKKIHQDLLAKFLALKEEFEKSQSLEQCFFDFLRLWLAAHIKGIDMKYGEHSISKKQSA